ncbi:uncharacterized protein TNCV_3022431 [Trichonephila clavipes]|nr:uncharacterized protein TNCV_3022431 [Trichonephila clavipes]
MHSLISLGSFLYGSSGYQMYVRCVYPDNGARTTRDVLVASLTFILLGMLFTGLFLLLAKEKMFVSAYTCYGIGLFYFLVVLLRVFLYYRLLRDLEATGVPFDPATYLSFANYLRIIAFLPPEGYSNSQIPVQNEDETIEHDKQS